MSKPEQQLKIEPPEALTFRGPFNVPSTSYMKLTNPSVHRLAFKIKTTAPKKYCVRPNCGFLEPQESIEIALCFQPFSYSPQDRTRHKFMVQSVVAPAAATNLEEVWKAAPADSVADSRLRCVFETPEEGQPAAERSDSRQRDDVKVELRRSLEEVERRLGEERAQLRAENERLRMVVLDMRKRMGVNVVEAAEEAEAAGGVAVPVVFQVALGLLTCLIGYIFGKYVF